jgi:hypothetical protein
MLVGECHRHDIARLANPGDLRGRALLPIESREGRRTHMSLGRAVLMLGALVLSVVSCPRRSDGAPDGTHPVRYVVFEIEKPGTIRAMSHRLVHLAEEPVSLGEKRARSLAAAPEREGRRVLARLLDGSGRTVFTSVVDVPRFVRGEFATDGTGRIDPLASALVEPERRAFVVRVPAVEGTRLVLQVGSAAEESSFDLDALAADATLPLASYRPAGLAASPFSSPGNRLDLLVMGDGYQSGEQAKFTTDAANIVATFFGMTPYSTYANFIETATLFTASAQSGADHPPYLFGCAGPPSQPTCCGDSSALSDTLAGTFVTTAFDSTFCYYDIQRLVGVNDSKVFTAAAAVPDWDMILLIVNDATYGGAGGSIPVFTANSLSVNIAQHEFGHSFMRLADEYATPFPGYPPCSDLGGSSPCEPNVTDQTTRSLIKWMSWIDGGTPIPTPDTSGYYGSVGLFQGARYKSTGMYRPQHTCLMQTLGEPFCSVCAQEFVLGLYSGGWGTPLAGIDNIEPGSESPAPGSVSALVGSPKTFFVSLLQPTGGPPLSVSWLVNGILSQSGGASFAFTPPSAGSYTVALQTHDPTTLVKGAMAGTSLDHGRTWNVTATCSLSAPVITAPTQVAADSVGNIASVVSHGGSTYSWGITGGTITAGQGTSQITFTAGTAGTPLTLSVTETNASGCVSAPGNATVTVASSAALFYTLPPCRVLDTRNATGPLGAPSLQPGATRTFDVAASTCGIPATARAISVNLAVTGPVGPGHLTLYPGDAVLAPLASTINFSANQTRANNTLLALASDGSGTIKVLAGTGGTVDFILDVNGFFQ